MILEINHNNNNTAKKTHKYVELKQYATEQPKVPEEITRRNKKMPGDKWKWKYNDLASMGHSQSNSKREVYNDISLPQETRKTFDQTHKENKGEGPNK